MIAIYDSIDQPMQNLVVDSNKMRPSYPLGIPATPKAYSLTPPPTVEHPERYWHTGDTHVDESDSDESEREHPDDADLEETHLGNTEREEPYDTDLTDSDSGNKDPYEVEYSDHHITTISRNHSENSCKTRSLATYYLRNLNRNRPY